MRLIVAAVLLSAPLSAQVPIVDCGTAADSVRRSESPLVVPFELINNHIYVKVCAGRRALDFILDTGAPNSFFDLTVARELGIDAGRGFRAWGGGPGTAAGARLDRTSISLAASRLVHWISTAIDFSGIRTREGQRIEGVLGYDFISRFVVAIDYSRRELRLYDRDEFRYAGPGAVQQVVISGNYPLVDAQLQLIDGTKLDARFLLDIGASRGLQLRKHWVDDRRIRDRVGPTIRRRGGSGIGGASSYDVGRLASIRLGGIDIARPVVLLYGDSAGAFSNKGPTAGDIGGDVLRRFTLFLDYGRKRIILEPNAEFSEPFEFDMSGLDLVLDSTYTALLVDAVAVGSPASEVGLTRGDRIVAVDGQPVNERSLDTLRRRFLRAAERVALTVQRGESTTVVTIHTRRLV